MATQIFIGVQKTSGLEQVVDFVLHNKQLTTNLESLNKLVRYEPIPSAT